MEVQKPVLVVENLRVSFNTPDGVVRAVNDLSFVLHEGETLGIVGESGSGKSVTASSLMRLNNSVTATSTGRVVVAGVEVLSASEDEVRRLRGSEIAMVFQDPMSALNPYYTVGHQIAEAYLVHHSGASKTEVNEKVLEMLRKVGIPNPEQRANDYPHQFSGGMRQRIVIAIALVNDPKILIADEPTTALDVTVQAQILDLMLSLQADNGMAILLITHDLGVIAEVARDVLVMYAGRVVERADVGDLFELPTHPYSWGLLGAVASLEDSGRGHLKTIEGTPPSLLNMPSGCAFHPRCSYASDNDGLCKISIPSLIQKGPEHSYSACHLSADRVVEIGRKVGSK
jgi:peptide/nickel transport system ATP-binding protein